mmetsp:Transcript_13425/g.40710  ORF Transcript_13425/g.40710 Transcript_13425/m.40710 type:complete len:209 (+) Transcript_13425:2006-2632(+)
MWRRHHSRQSLLLFATRSALHCRLCGTRSSCANSMSRRNVLAKCTHGLSPPLSIIRLHPLRAQNHSLRSTVSQNAARFARRNASSGRRRWRPSARCGTRRGGSARRKSRLELRRNSPRSVPKLLSAPDPLRSSRRSPSRLCAGTQSRLSRSHPICRQLNDSAKHAAWKLHRPSGSVLGNAQHVRMHSDFLAISHVRESHKEQASRSDH